MDAHKPPFHPNPAARSLLILHVAERTHRLSATSAALAVVCVVLGILMGVVTLLNVFVLGH